MKKNYSILWFGQRWDKYQRRDRQLIPYLAKISEIESIVLIEPPLPLTSIIIHSFLIKSMVEAKPSSS